MNKTAIKNFAIWARNKLIADVSYDARLIGITEDGIAKPLPQSFGGTQFFDIGTAEPYSISGEAVRQRDKLIEVIQQKEKDTDYKTAYQYVIEEVAYTWFNRLIAIRFMEVNDYLPSHIRFFLPRAVSWSRIWSQHRLTQSFPSLRRKKLRFPAEAGQQAGRSVPHPVPETMCNA